MSVRTFEYKQEKAEEWLWKGQPEMSIEIPEEFIQEIFAYVDAVPTEISGLGDIEIEGDVLKIVKLRMFKQECTSGETTIDPQQLEEMTVQAAESNDDMSKLRLWWHSHANMSTFWSGQDETCIKDLLGCFRDYVVSIVVNKKRDLLARLDIRHKMMGREVTHTHHRLKVNVVRIINKTLEERVKEEVERLVSTPAAKMAATDSSRDTNYRAGSQHGGSPSYHRSRIEHQGRISEPYKSGKMLIGFGYVHAITGYKWDALKKDFVKPENDTEHTGIITALRAIRKHEEQSGSSWKKKQCETCGSERKVKYHHIYQGSLCKTCRGSINREVSKHGCGV